MKFELAKYDFESKDSIVQILSSTSHDGMHLAFNQGGRTISFYDYSTLSPARVRSTDPLEESKEFPGLISYDRQDQDVFVGTLKAPLGETIKIFKEVDAGVWLIQLLQA